MSYNRIGRRAALAALGVAVAILLGGGNHPAFAQGFGLHSSESAARAPQRYVLTISGGISLGAYEAGLNWAVLRYLKRHQPGALEAGGGSSPGAELVGVTGASAGNINALLSAIAWCQRPEFDRAETPEANLFWDAWIDVGIENLFPGPADGAAYAPDDGIFTRRAFHDIESSLLRTMGQQSRFQPGCRLPVGVTVTRNRLAALELKDSRDSGPGMRIDTQRFVVTFEARTGSRGLEIHERARQCEDPTVGHYLRFSRAGGGLVPPRDVLDIVEASSAFPLAFGPKTLRHHEPSTGSNQSRCPTAAGSPDGTCSEPFFDGGVFDNVPLGLGVSLALPPDPASCPPAGNGGDLEFVYVDPGRRRGSESTVEANSSPAPGRIRRGLSSAKVFIENFVTVSRQYELQSAARYVFDRLFQRHRAESFIVGQGAPAPSNAGPVARLRLSSRFHPLVAEHLGAFAAFFARPFREHDFLVGVYDALIGIADTECQGQSDGKDVRGVARWSTTRADCVSGRVAKVMEDLELPRSPGATRLLARLLAGELERSVGDRMAATRALDTAKVGSRTLGAWRHAQDGGFHLPAAVFETLAAETRREESARRAGAAALEKLEERPAFIRFVDAFRGQLGRGWKGGVGREMSAAERRFVSDPSGELQGFVADVLERQRQVEEDDGYGTGKHLLSGAQMLLHSEPLRPHVGLDLDPSSVPDRRLTVGRGFAHLVPFHVSGDFNHRGLSLGWRPGYWFGNVGVGVPLSLLNWEIPVGRMYGTVGLSALFHRDSFFWSELELGPRLTAWYLPWPTDFGPDRLKPGAEVAFYLLAGKLRVAVGVLDARKYDQIGTWTFKAGVADANGLFYWMTQFLGL